MHNYCVLTDSYYVCEVLINLINIMKIEACQGYMLLLIIKMQYPGYQLLNAF